MDLPQVVQIKLGTAADVCSKSRVALCMIMLFCVLLLFQRITVAKFGYFNQLTYTFNKGERMRYIVDTSNINRFYDKTYKNVIQNETVFLVSTV